MNGATDGSQGARIEVVAGGELGAEELAALVVALTPVRSEDGAATAEDDDLAWRRAALLEGVGDAAPVTSAADLAGRTPTS